MRQPPIHTPDPRAAAWLAVMLSEKRYVADTLDEWSQKARPKTVDIAFAREVASGTVRRRATLDFYIQWVGSIGKLKSGEKALLRTAVYQLTCMDRVPDYALTDETIKIVRKYCHPSIAPFFNVVLRKLAENRPDLPEGPTVKATSIRLSFPESLVQTLFDQYGADKAIAILEQSNIPPPLMARKRDGEIITLEAAIPSPDYYIQNITPATLLQNALTHIPEPKKILDLCASPGGKAVAAYDRFPEADLFVNDIKKHPLAENLTFYNVLAYQTTHHGQEYPDGELFDLIICDLPCSNTGVLAKRPEARWRTSSPVDLQRTLLTRASQLLAPKGHLLYMTCSILRDENEAQADWATTTLNLTPTHSELVLPSPDGHDGGYAALLQKS